jgi:hypothetical protein
VGEESASYSVYMSSELKEQPEYKAISIHFCENGFFCTDGEGKRFAYPNSEAVVNFVKQELKKLEE